jgi:hypothetical protein
MTNSFDDVAARIRDLLTGLGIDPLPAIVPAYLAGRRSPLSTSTVYLDDRRTIVWFRALDVLAWLCARGAVNVVTKVGDDDRE